MVIHPVTAAAGPGDQMFQKQWLEMLYDTWYLISTKGVSGAVAGPCCYIQDLDTLYHG